MYLLSILLTSKHDGCRMEIAMIDDKWVSNGIVAGIVAGIFFAFFVILDNISKNLGALIGMPTRLEGLFILLIVTLIAGIVFSFIFGSLIHTWTAAISWGLFFGLVMWILGPMTLLPTLANGKPLFSQWSHEGLHENFSILIGHLIYGLVLGLSYCFLKKGKLHQLRKPKRLP